MGSSFPAEARQTSCQRVQDTGCSLITAEFASSRKALSNLIIYLDHGDASEGFPGSTRVNFLNPTEPKRFSRQGLKPDDLSPKFSSIPLLDRADMIFR